jgi:hypothetical protein
MPLTGRRTPKQMQSAGRGSEAEMMRLAYSRVLNSAHQCRRRIRRLFCVPGYFNAKERYA